MNHNNAPRPTAKRPGPSRIGGQCPATEWPYHSQLDHGHISQGGQPGPKPRDGRSQPAGTRSQALVCTQIRIVSNNQLRSDSAFLARCAHQTLAEGVFVGPHPLAYSRVTPYEP